MARKGKSSRSRKFSKAKSAEIRANWRALEKLGVVKKRAKGEKIKVTAYKAQRIKQLAPVLSGKAKAVPLGPKALRAARENNTPLAGRFAIVPNTKTSIANVREGKPVSRTYAFDKTPRDVDSRAVRAIVRAARAADQKKPINETAIEKRVARMSAEQKRAVAKTPRFDSRQEYLDYWDDLDVAFDDDLYPGYYH